MNRSKKIIIYALAYSIALVLFIFMCHRLFDFYSETEILEHPSVEYNSFVNIWKHNTQNFISYMLVFPIYPVLILMDFIGSAMPIVASIEINGVSKTLIALLPHGIIEIPNFILYSFLSGEMFLIFWRTRNLSIFNEIKKRRYYYLISYLLLIVAAAVEGMVTPIILKQIN
ncbi:stage II sporulation protein M [Pseudobutyrivibrio sp.]|uniref:stage II sporulation protein M n=1 Tax=Pseudobutyrivibrio sp. TaxID=2014367 RepID=UPI0025FBAE60|nr:stage II sporulation protein M [Pseudobutyrivibrio sp.]